MDQPGGIIVLDIIDRDYSLSQIAQIVESNNVKDTEYVYYFISRINKAGSHSKG